jgi:hypothetical protein
MSWPCPLVLALSLCLLNEALTEHVDVDTNNNQPATLIEKAEQRMHLLPQEEEALI